MGFLSKLFGGKSGIELDVLLEVVPDYFEQHFGVVESVWHEIVSDKIHVDIHWIEGNEKCLHRVIFTTGMSMKPMPGEPRFAEMFMLLPPDWPLEKIQEDETAYWPVFILKTFARLPIYNKLTLQPFMTIPYDEVGGFAPGTFFDSFMVLNPREMGPQFGKIRADGENLIQPYLVAPLLSPETEYKIKQETADGLWEELKRRGSDVSKLFATDLNRPSLI